MLKKFTFLIFLFAFTITAIAQPDSIYTWNKWCSRKDTLVLFADGNNVIQIYSRAFKPADITVKSLDKALRIGTPEMKADTLNVLAMPFPEKGKQMRLAILNKKTRKQLKIVTCYCDTIPPLVAKIGNITAPEAKRKDIVSQMTIKACFPKSLYSYPYTIKQFVFRVTSSKGSATIPVKGFFIPNTVIKEIGDAPEGTVVEFTDIKATCPECATRGLENLRIRIK